MAALKPLLNLVGKKRGIIIAPLPRYLVSGCCSNPEHCSNRRLLDFEQQQKQSLEYLKKMHQGLPILQRTPLHQGAGPGDGREGDGS
jgi:hypothetical protein